jgi:4-hydroxy-4-methyl-2-oxoglutarate aldolase
MTEEQKKFLMNTPTGVISDAMSHLDIVGWMNDIFPINPRYKFVGTAATIQCAYVRGKDDPLVTHFSLIDKCKPGDVVVIDAMGENHRLMGEHVVDWAIKKGVVALVLNGRTRDYSEILARNFPLFCKGPAMKPRAKDFRFANFNVPINCAGAYVIPGDVVVGDVDGVLVIPDAHLEEVIKEAKKIICFENEIGEAIAKDEKLGVIHSIIKKYNKF